MQQSSKRTMQLCTQNQHKQGGFTLLELLLVVTILSSTAMLAMMTMETKTAQHRIQETQQKLQLLKKATLQTVNYNGVNFDMGYVVDNGGLPPCVKGLLTADDCDSATQNSDEGGSDMEAYGLLAPYFDPTPDSDGFNEGADGIELAESNEKLWKGFRAVYLNSIVTDEFRDGWGSPGLADGTACPDAATGSTSSVAESANYGWCHEKTDEDSLIYRSYGRDALSSAAAGYANESAQDIDTAIELSSSEWMTEGDIEVEIVNKFISDSLSPNKNKILVPSDNYALVMLVFENGEDRGVWRQISEIGGVKTELTDLVPCDNSSGDCGESTNPYKSHSVNLTLSKPLPIGEHILFLAPADASGLTDTAVPCLDTDGDGNCSGEKRLTRKFTVYSKIGIPNNKIEWVIE